MKKNYMLLKSFVVLLSLFTIKLNAQLSGVVTINSGAPASATNYQSFSALASTLSTAGVSGPLVVNVTPASGYTEQPVFSNIPGVSATNTITVNGNGTQLTFNSSNSNQPWVLGLDGADWMYFNNLNVSGTGSYAYALTLADGADNNYFTACTFSVPNTGSSSSQIGVVISGSMIAYYYYSNAGSNNTWKNCVISGGYFGVSMYAPYNPPINGGNSILTSTITNFYAYGIYQPDYQKNTTFKGNIINRINRTSSPSNVYGIYTVYNEGTLIDGNRIQNFYDAQVNASGSATGIYISDNHAGGSKANPNIVRNNVISDFKNNGTQYGIRAFYIDGYVYHNTIVFDYSGSTGGTCYGMYCYAFNPLDMEIKNNNVYITRAGTGTKYGYYSGGITSNMVCDKNNYYVNSSGGTNYIGYWTSPATSLSALQGQGTEPNSFSADPMFVSAASQNYAPTQTSINNSGAPVGVYQDVNLNPRSGTQPDIGAYEFLSLNCVSSPSANAIAPNAMTVCPGEKVDLGLANYYSDLGITYQWKYSYTSAVGPYTNVIGATNNQYTTPNNNQTTWYSVQITCNNGGGAINPTAEVDIEGTIVSTVPYHEGFEGVTKTNHLPNCSWASSSLGANALTYTTTMNQNRNAHTGNKFAAFYAYYVSGSTYFYSNGIQLYPGITYSASLWYQTDFYTYPNVTDLSILLGTSQSTTGLVSIASSNGLVASPVYKALANTFQVSTAGVYYVAVRLTSNGNYGTSYVEWDDLDITIPCSLNSPTLTLNTNTNVICKGDAVNMSVSGGDDYTWSNGMTGSSINAYPAISTQYSVVGTNTLSGCTTTLVSPFITVNPSPFVYVYTNKPVVCSGESANLAANATGNVTYQWSNNGATTNMITVTPSASTAYTVIATNVYGCSATAVQSIVVAPNPTVTINATTSGQNQICKGESAMLAGVGASSYTWAASSIYIQSPIAIVNPVVSTTYTLSGSDANGCVGKTTLNLAVDECTGINKINASSSGIKLYPNPNTGVFLIESSSTAAKTVEVVDVTGRVISSSTSSADKITVNINNYANGIYYVKVQSENGVDVIKVVKH